MPLLPLLAAILLIFAILLAGHAMNGSAGLDANGNYASRVERR